MKQKIKALKNVLVTDKVLLLLSLLIVLFDYVDGGLSWYLIMYRHLGFEANPFMAYLMRQGAGWFLGFKFLLFPVLIFFLYKTRRHPVAQIGIYTCFILYGTLIIYFIFSMFMLVNSGLI